MYSRFCRFSPKKKNQDKDGKTWGWPPQQEKRESSGRKSVRREAYNLLPLFISGTRLHAYKRCWAAAPPNFDPTLAKLTNSYLQNRIISNEKVLSMSLTILSVFIIILLMQFLYIAAFMLRLSFQYRFLLLLFPSVYHINFIKLLIIIVV